jgi:hypothetical protein
MDKDQQIQELLQLTLNTADDNLKLLVKQLEVVMEMVLMALATKVMRQRQGI